MVASSLTKLGFRMKKTNCSLAAPAAPFLQAVCFVLATLLIAPAHAQSPSPPPEPILQASQLLDISGVSWIDDDVFVVVHDGKSDGMEGDLPRVSLLLLPADATVPPEFAREAPSGIYFQNLVVEWPSSTPNDLESIARIPGTRQLLLVESGDGCKREFQRIFLTSLSAQYELSVDEVAHWPLSETCAYGVYNVEATAVFQLGDQYFFVYAERAEGQPYTNIRWAQMQLNPLRFGEFSSVRYAARVRGPGVRPIVALDVDDAGNVYAATAYDSGFDNGPFRSWASRIGQFRGPRGGNARFIPSGAFADIATQDGYKIEGIAARPGDGGAAVFAGTDDENYGATLRQVGIGNSNALF
jgi:hypothetical protein